MTGDRSVTAVDCTSQIFQRGLRRIKDRHLREQIKETIRSLLFLDLDAAPAKLHLHQLKSKKVPSALEIDKKVPVWTIHVTRDDCYKASFTFERGVVYFRVCDEHDIVDRDP